AFFTLADLLQQRDFARALGLGAGLHFRPALGLVVAVVALASMLVSVWILRRDELRAVPPLAWAVVPSVSAALLVALLLPWARYFAPDRGQAMRGVDDATGVGL